MAEVFSQLLDFVRNAPGSFVYHLCVLLLLLWAVAQSWQGRSVTLESAPLAAWGFTLAYGARLVFALLASAIAFGWLSAPILPPLEMAGLLATWSLPALAREKKISLAGLIAATAVIVLAGLANALWANQNFSGGMLEKVWLVGIFLVSSLSGVRFLRDPLWALASVLMALTAGLALLLNVPAYLRLAELFALPLLCFSLLRVNRVTLSPVPPAPAPNLYLEKLLAEVGNLNNFSDLLRLLTLHTAQSSDSQAALLWRFDPDSGEAICLGGSRLPERQELSGFQLPLTELGFPQVEILPTGGLLPASAARALQAHLPNCQFSQVWVGAFALAEEKSGWLMCLRQQPYSPEQLQRLSDSLPGVQHIWRNWQQLSEARAAQSRLQKEQRESEENFKKAQTQINLLTQKLQAADNQHKTDRNKIGTLKQEIERQTQRLAALSANIHQSDSATPGAQVLANAQQQILDLQQTLATQQQQHDQKTEKLQLALEDAQAVARQMKQHLDNLSQKQKNAAGDDKNAMQLEAERLSKALASEQARVAELEYLLESLDTGEKRASASDSQASLAEIRTLTEQLLSEKAGILIGRQRDVLSRIAEQLAHLQPAPPTPPQSQPTPALQFENVQLGSVIDSVFLDVSARFREKQLVWQLDFSDQLPVVQADPHAIYNVLETLMTRACENSPIRGEVRLGAHVDRQNAQARLQVSVQDTGSFLTPASQLGDVKKMVRAHGGDLQSNSLAPQKHQVAFWLPIAEQAGK